MIDLSIRGIQEIQQDNIQRIAALKPGGKISKEIKNIVIWAHRYLVSVTHVDTGAYRASQRMDVKELTGKLYVDPLSINPVSRERPADYGVFEEARGGEHAAYARTLRYVETNLLRNGITAMRTHIT